MLLVALIVGVYVFVGLIGCLVGLEFLAGWR